MRTEDQTQGEASGSLESTGGVDMDAESARERPRVGRRTEEKEGSDYVCRQVRQRVQTVVLAGLAYTHASQKRCDSEADEGRYSSGVTPPATLTPVPKLPNEVCAETVPHNAPAGEAWPAEKGS
ncbi:hypothetical protein ERJ75_000812000 [Trypanosoma vivax]|nr:hypothetical protein ERJ75_000812000 [Trypanosoma vivax]